jgi:hypothetical protein
MTTLNFLSRPPTARLLGCLRRNAAAASGSQIRVRDIGLRDQRNVRARTSEHARDVQADAAAAAGDERCANAAPPYSPGAWPAATSARASLRSMTRKTCNSRDQGRSEPQGRLVARPSSRSFQGRRSRHQGPEPAPVFATGRAPGDQSRAPAPTRREGLEMGRAPAGDPRIVEIVTNRAIRRCSRLSAALPWRCGSPTRLDVSVGLERLHTTLSSAGRGITATECGAAVVAA